MTVARSVADVLTEHVPFEIECIDRMYLNVYVPQLQYAAGLVGYVHRQLGLPIASTAPLAKITDAFSAAVHRFAKVNRVPWVDFVKGQRKDDVMHEQLGRVHRHRGGACSSGGRRRRPPCSAPRNATTRNGESYPWIVKTTGRGQPLLLLLRGRRLRPVLPQVLLLLPVQRQAVPQRPRVGQTPGRARPGSGSPRWTTGSPRSTIRRRCRRSATSSGPIRSTRCCASGWPSCRTRSPPTIGPPATATTCRSCRPSSR